MWYFACVNGRVLQSCNCGLEIIIIFYFSGDSSASFSVSVVADDIPELNESFNVQLLSVAQSGQDIAPNNVSME